MASKPALLANNAYPAIERHAARSSAIMCDYLHLAFVCTSVHTVALDGGPSETWREMLMPTQTWLVAEVKTFRKLS
jgi:hypothetical protein